MTNTLLEMRHIKKHFPGVQALKDVSFELLAGEVHALLGENGAGKSTLIKILGGIYAAGGGVIYINGKETAIHSVEDAQQNGISIIHQELALVPNMTVAENIFLGREIMQSGVISYTKMNEAAREKLESFGLAIESEALVNTLTIAQQQMVEIIKALSFNAKILVMDEPTSSLSERDVAFLFETIRKLKQNNVGIVYISHRMSELYQITDRITVMRDGEYIGTKETAKTNNDELIGMMVGRTLTNYYTRTYNIANETVLEVKNLSDGRLIKNISFDVKKGEILGFAGLVGSGRSEIMKCIFGIDRFTEGSIFVEGKEARINSPDDAMRFGLALVPESRKTEALFPAQSVRFNITLEALAEFIKGIVVNSAKEETISMQYVNNMRIKTPSLEQLINNLSGGNQQKAIIGRALATLPKVLILDEPTRGVDVAAKAEIYAVMNALVKEGLAIIMISSELPEVINMSDRVIVMHEGRVSAALSRDGITQETIMRYATGSMA
ncbi:MAG: sugar ABC transporter ATP-binding protein [Termitinemataceae bacterium]|jgi:ABC-type sugar transport system ATPase subunit|nr:MAG: sugar ABC transporter ATP-binding protein [Termitinemataceae bacterium]